MPYLSLGHHYWAFVLLFLEEVTQFTTLSYLIPLNCLGLELIQITPLKTRCLCFCAFQSKNIASNKVLECSHSLSTCVLCLLLC